MSFPLIKLGDLFEIQIGKTPSRANQNYWTNGLYNWLSIADMNQGKYLDRTKEKINDLAIKESNIKLIPENTVVLSYKLSIGKVGITKKSMFTNEAIASLIPLNNNIDINFLYWALQHIDLMANTDRAAMGQTLNKAKLKEIKIPLPPLSGQKRIAQILDKADEIRQKRQQSIEKLDELLQATFIDMFGDPVTNPKGWDVEKLDNLMTIVRGGSPRPIEKFLGGDYPWIKIGDATKGDDLYISKTKESITEAGLKKTRLLPEGSLIFANCGVSLGFARILKIQGCIHDGWLAFQNIDEERVNKIFLLKALNSVTQFFRDTAPDGTQPNLNTAIMKEFKLIIPPMIEQLKFEQIVYSINEQKEKLINQLFNQEYLFQSLQQRAFNGEL